MSGHISKGVCTWLECCGHLSAFEIGGIRYYVDANMFDYWDKKAQNMQMRLDTVLHPGQTCSYEYDFGSATQLRIKVIAEREVPASGDLIRILARNSSPIPCDICGKPATSTCTPCSNDDEAYLCDDCAKHHQCEPEKLSPILNSPHAGVCGYPGIPLRIPSDLEGTWAAINQKRAFRNLLFDVASHEIPAMLQIGRT